MTTKQLSIQVKLSDAASSGLRSLASQAVTFGKRVSGVAGEVGSKLGGIARNLLSMKTLVVGIVGALAGGAAFQSLRRAAEELDEIVKTSRQLGVSAQFLSELKYTADLAGLSFEALSTSSAKMMRNIEEAARTGGGKAAHAFRELGVRLREADGTARPFETVLLDLSDAFSTLDNDYKRVAYSQDIFGKSGTVMLRLLELGRPAIAAMADEARKLGVVFTDEQLANAEAFNDSISRIGKAWLGLRANIIGTSGDDIAELMNEIASGIAAVPEIAGNVSKVFRRAFDPKSPEGQATLNALGDLGQGIYGVANAIGVGVLAIVTSYGQDGLLIFKDLILQGGKQIGVDLIEVAAEQYIRLKEYIEGPGAGDLIREGIKELRGQASEQESFAQRYTRVVGDIGQNTGDWAYAVDTLGASLVRVGQDADALFGISEALSKTAIEASHLPPIMREINEEAQSLNEGLAGLKEGWVSAMSVIQTESRNTARVGGDIAKSLTVDLSQGLGAALVDNVGKWKDMGKAAVGALRDVSKQIATTITNYLILKTIMGIAGSFGGSVASGASGSIGGTGSTATASFGGAAFANKGMRSARSNLSLSGAALAAITSAGVPAYAMGTSSVPGPHTNRDVTLAMLTPREAVLTPRAADTLGRDRIDHLNRGGSMESGGMVFAPNITVNVQASPGTDGAQVGRDIGRNLAAELLKELARNPGARAQFRSQLA